VPARIDAGSDLLVACSRETWEGLHERVVAPNAEEEEDVDDVRDPAGTEKVETAPA
jgi:hypothetical protein